jgi:hypothetical protein
MMFQINREGVTSREMALDKLSTLLVSPSFLWDVQGKLQEDFWDDLIVFCDQWQIPFWPEWQLELSNQMIASLGDPYEKLCEWCPSRLTC